MSFQHRSLNMSPYTRSSKKSSDSLKLPEHLGTYAYIWTSAFHSNYQVSSRYSENDYSEQVLEDSFSKIQLCLNLTASSSVLSFPKMSAITTRLYSGYITTIFRIPLSSFLTHAMNPVFLVTQRLSFHHSMKTRERLSSYLKHSFNY